EPGERGGGVAARVAPRLEVIRDGDSVQADLLGEDTDLEQLARPELLCRGLVAEPRHRASLRPALTSRSSRSRVWAVTGAVARRGERAGCRRRRSRRRVR